MGFSEVNNLIKRGIERILLDMFVPCFTKKNLNKTRKNYLEKGYIRVLFLLQYPEMWNSEKSVYNELNQDDRFVVDVLALPRRSYENNQKNKFLDMSSYNFCVKENINATNAVVADGFVSLEDYHPDFIFIQYPYNTALPKPYTFYHLCKAGLICYIPYFAKQTDTLTKKFREVNTSFMLSFFFFFADSKARYNYVSNWINSHGYSRIKKVAETGFPRYDLISFDVETVPLEEKDRITVLYTPRGTPPVVDRNVESPGHFWEFIDELIDFFDSDNRYYLVIRPHPNFFYNYLTKGWISENEVERIKSRIRNSNYISFDSNEDYLKSFSGSDILLADFTSLMLEYFYTGKPIVFCDTYTATGIFKKIYDTYYICNNPKEAIKTILEVSTADPKCSIRKEVLSEVRPKNQSAAKRIKEELLSVVDLPLRR